MSMQQNSDVQMTTGTEAPHPMAPPVLPSPSVDSQMQREAGLMALAGWTDEAFDTRLAQLKQGKDRLERIMLTLLEPNVDYGRIPGTPTPTLLKPGAEKLCFFFRLAPSYTVIRTAGDGITAPSIHYQVTCQMHLGSTAGPVIAEGVGSASSWQKKHRYREGMKTCPRCGQPTIFASKQGAGWFCWRKKGGCGAEFNIDEPKIIVQTGMTENPDPHDLDNTLLKMAKKSSFIDGTLTGCAASGLFTQDIEDMATAAIAAEEAAQKPTAGPAGVTMQPDKASSAVVEEPAPTVDRAMIKKSLLDNCRELKLKTTGQVREYASQKLGRIVNTTTLEDVTVEELVKLVEISRAEIVEAVPV